MFSKGKLILISLRLKLNLKVCFNTMIWSYLKKDGLKNIEKSCLNSLKTKPTITIINWDISFY